MKKNIGKRKRWLAVAMAFALLWSVTACGDDVKNPKAGSDKKQETQNASEPESESEEITESKIEETSEQETESEPEETMESSNEEASKQETETAGTEQKPADDRYPKPESEGLEFVHDMKIGWNLGNTFDAIDCTWLSNEMDYESAWNGAKTTKQQIVALKEAGFNSIRIPVSWHNHLSDRTNYTISSQWLERVAEVVDYCVEEDMYVIINIHHDNSEEFLFPTKEHLDQSIRYVTSIWKQLADRFGDYDEHLIFDCMNEPRLVGHPNEWWLNNSADCKEAVECINQINQAFVDTVRATGGNNATRYLMCPGYCASPDGVLSDDFVLPRDPVDNDNHIIVSVHAYTPYNFALEYPGTSEWSSKRASDMTNMISFMNKLYNKFVSKGVPVVIDEFGARDKGGNLEARVDFASHYVAYARARGISCFWWDNNAFVGDGELFGLLDRSKCEWRYPEIVQAMMEFAE